MNAHVDRGAICVHHRKTLGAVGLQGCFRTPTYRSGIPGSRRPSWPGQAGLIHDAGMLDAPARIGTGILGLGAFNGSEHHVDLTVAVGMRGNLPSRIPPLLNIFVQLLLGARRRNAEIAGPVGIRLAEPCGPAAERVTLKVFEGSNPKAIVAEAASEFRRPAVCRSFQP